MSVDLAERTTASDQDAARKLLSGVKVVDNDCHVVQALNCHAATLGRCVSQGHKVRRPRAAVMPC